MLGSWRGKERKQLCKGPGVETNCVCGETSRNLVEETVLRQPGAPAPGQREVWSYQVSAGPLVAWGGGAGPQVRLGEPADVCQITEPAGLDPTKGSCPTHDPPHAQA